MNDDRSIERTARFWLEEGPTKAPDHAVRAALSQIAATRQERRRLLHLGGMWRHVPMPAVAGFAVLAVVVIGGALLFWPGRDQGPASPSLVPTAAPPAASLPPASPAAVVPPVTTATFISPRNGYSVQYPGDWTVTPATARWEPGGVNAWGSPALDELRGSTARFVGSSQPLGAGQTGDAWLAGYAGAACVGPLETWPTVTIGSATGRIDADGCLAPGGSLSREGPLFDAVVIFGGRAYNFSMSGELSRSDFTAVLATVTLDPTSAVDTDPTP